MDVWKHVFITLLYPRAGEDGLLSAGMAMCRFLHCLRSGLGISSLYEVRALSRSTSLEHNTEGTRPKRVGATINSAENRDSMDAIMWSKRGMASVFLK